MTTLTILLLTAAIEAPLFYLRAIQRAVLGIRTE